MCPLAAFVPHRPNKYFHVTASNGIVSNSPYTPLAIMTASPIASVRVFDPRCRCRLATFGALPTRSMIEPIIMLTDHPLLAPHRQVRRCHRSIHCWHGHAARRSALPRERFSPLARNGPVGPVWRCPLCGADRKRLAQGQIGAFDPSRTLYFSSSCRFCIVASGNSENCRIAAVLGRLS
jgi:hypothetical protein